jgi:hypothetical protein
MFDTGCVLSGSRALEYFVPGSTTPHSDWDFYVPGYKESVYEMINALTRCGVLWHLEADSIAKGLLENGYALIATGALKCLSSWTRGMEPYEGSRLLGEDVYKIVQEFQHHCENQSLVQTYKASFTPQGNVELEPAGPEVATNTCNYDNTDGGVFSILHGHIETPQGSESVQLIIGSCWSNIRGCMSFIKSFYASHVQTFSEPQDEGPHIRTFADNQAYMIDYGDMYRDFFPSSKHMVLLQLLRERRENLQSISWVESGGALCIFSPMRLRNANSGDDQNRTCLFGILLEGECLTCQGNQAVMEAARSGTVWAGLRDATPWSWVM